MIDKQRLPDGVGLLHFGHRPELVVGQVELPETLGDEVVVDEQLIDPPEQQFAKRRVVKMRMNIVDRRAMDDVGDRFTKGGGGMHGTVVKRRTKSSTLFRGFGGLLGGSETATIPP